MVAFHLWFLALTGAVLARLLWGKHLKDAVLFAVLALAAYGLWLPLANHRHYVITIFIEKIIESVK